MIESIVNFYNSEGNLATLFRGFCKLSIVLIYFLLAIMISKCSDHPRSGAYNYGSIEYDQ